MMQYAAFIEEINGDSTYVKFTPDKAKAFDDAQYRLSRLTERERKSHIVSVRGWDVPEETTYEQWTDDMLFAPDPDFYEVIK